LLDHAHEYRWFLITKQPIGVSLLTSFPKHTPFASCLSKFQDRVNRKCGKASCGKRTSQIELRSGTANYCWSTGHSLTAACYGATGNVKQW
jgi:hypothetical protein